MADRYGRRQIIATMTYGMALSYLFYVFAPSWHFILISDAPSSITKGDSNGYIIANAKDINVQLTIRTRRFPLMNESSDLSRDTGLQIVM